MFRGGGGLNFVDETNEISARLRLSLCFPLFLITLLMSQAALESSSCDRKFSARATFSIVSDEAGDVSSCTRELVVRPEIVRLSLYFPLFPKQRLRLGVLTCLPTASGNRSRQQQPGSQLPSRKLTVGRCSQWPWPCLPACLPACFAYLPACLPMMHERLSGGDFLHTSLVILTCRFLALYGGGDFLHTSTVVLMKMQCSTIQMAPQKDQMFNISKENKAFLKP